MTSEEMERGLVGLQENMTVQGVMMHRLGNGLEGLRVIAAENSTAIAQNTEAIGQLAQAMARSMEAIGKLTDAMRAMQDTVIEMQDGMKVMQAAMNNLFEHMDRFIRGLESDGHKGGKKKRPD